MIDKSGWGPGPWQAEPDHAEFRHRGLACLIHRNQWGVWCGYVGAPPGHPWHGGGYDEVPADVHGGLTYSSACAGDICHVPLPGEPDDVWWLGFDCGHAGDLTPYYRSLGFPFGDELYRDEAYVRREVARLADQALAAAKGGS